MQCFGGHGASPASRATLKAWHNAVDAALSGNGDSDAAMKALGAHMEPACIFRPPTYFKPWTGRDEVLCLLQSVSEVFGPSFMYGRQWLSDDGREWALEFSAEVGNTGRTVHGIDLVSLSEQGKIAELTVLARPPNAVEALKGEMIRKVPMRIAALKAKQTLGLA